MRPKTIVSVADPALDRTAMDVRRYAETRDESLIREATGSKAVRFKLRELDYAMYNAAVMAGSAANSVAVFILYGLASISLPNGTEILPTKETSPASGPAIRIWNDAELAVLYRRFGGRRMIELASVIETLAHVGEGEGSFEGNVEGGGVYFTLPPSSQLELEQIARRHAVQTQTGQPTQS